MVISVPVGSRLAVVLILRIPLLIIVAPEYVQAEAMATLPIPSFTKGPVPEITTAVWTIPCPPEPVSERVPPPLSRIVITELQNDAPEAGGDVVVFRKTAVAPFRVNDPPVDP